MRSSSGPLAARDPKNGLAAGGAEISMRRRVAPAARTRPMVPVEPTADGAALYSAVQLRRGPRTAHGPSWARGQRYPAEHAARCRSCGVANGVVNQVGQPSGTAHGSSELVKAHTPRRGRPSCRNTMLQCRIRSITPPGGVVGAAPSVDVLAGSAEPPPAPTLTSRLEGGLEVVVATAVLSPLGRGSGWLRSHENCCRRTNVLGTR